MSQADDHSQALTGVRCYFFPMAPPSSLRGMALLALATIRAVLVILRTRPRVTFATGGYVSTPAAVASWLLRVPVVLFLPDVVPGKAVGWLAPVARRIAASTEEALLHLPADKTVVTGYPVRDVFTAGRDPMARTRFQLPADGTVLLVVGGSQGARSINDAVARLLPDLLSRYHLIHVCGEQRYEEARAAAIGLPEDRQARYRLHPYLDGDDMAAAFGSADLVLSRAGASVLGELPAMGTPAVLVPFPAPGVHQRANADYLAKRGAAVVVDDTDLTDRLGPVLEELLDDRVRLHRMARACQALARPEAAATIAALLTREAA